MNIIIPNGKCCEEVTSNMVVTTYAIDNLQSTAPPKQKRITKTSFVLILITLVKVMQNLTNSKFKAFFFEKCT